MLFCFRLLLFIISLSDPAAEKQLGGTNRSGIIQKIESLNFLIFSIYSNMFELYDFLLSNLFNNFGFFELFESLHYSYFLNV